jgi:RNA polymerase I-specific transcription initiation factor RRN7
MECGQHICRDIWALFLELVPRPIPPEPHNFAQQDGSDEIGGNKDRSDKVPVGSKPSEPPGSGPIERNGLNKIEEENGQDVNETTVGSESDSSSDSDLDPNDDELERLMRENSELESSENEDEDGSTGPAAAKPVTKRSKSGSRQIQQLYESPANNIAILVLACWTLRVPIAYHDFSRWVKSRPLMSLSLMEIPRAIESYELPYLDPIRLLPQSMIQHLGKHTKQALSPHVS